MPNRRKPNELHIVNGTFRKDRHGDKDANPEVEAVKKMLNPPTRLNKYGKTEWNRLLQGMIDAGLLSTIDLSTVETACYFYGLHKELAVKLNEQPSLFDFVDQRTSQNNNVIRTMNESYKNYTDIVYKFGVSPVERSKIQLEKKPKDNSNPFADAQ